LDNIVTPESWLEVTQDHRNWYRSKIWYGFLVSYSPSVTGCAVAPALC